ncbi:MAG TPA: hypothetical protein VH540_18250 [Ktedonobacterales bacterium]|jgi:hypothetical protein
MHTSSKGPPGIRHSGPLAPLPAPVKTSALRQMVSDLARHPRQQFLLGLLLGFFPSPALLVLATHVGWFGTLLLVFCLLGVFAPLPLATRRAWRLLGYGLMWGWVVGVFLACALVVILTHSSCLENCNLHPVAIP